MRDWTRAVLIPFAPIFCEITVDPAGIMTSVAVIVRAKRSVGDALDEKLLFAYENELAARLGMHLCSSRQRRRGDGTDQLLSLHARKTSPLAHRRGSFRI